MNPVLKLSLNLRPFTRSYISYNLQFTSSSYQCILLNECFSIISYSFVIYGSARKIIQVVY